MSEEAHKAVARRIYAEVFSQGKVDAMDELANWPPGLWLTMTV